MSLGLSRSTYHGQGVHIRRSERVPLRHELAGRAGIGAIVIGQTRLIWAHGPSGILFIYSDWDQAHARRKVAGACAFGQDIFDIFTCGEGPAVFVLILVVVSLAKSLEVL